MGTGHHDSAPSPASSFDAQGPMPARLWRLRVGFWLLIGIAAFFLVTEHRAHLVAGLSWLPVLLLLACPLIHMPGRRGHDGSRPHSHERDLP